MSFWFSNRVVQGGGGYRHSHQNVRRMALRYFETRSMVINITTGGGAGEYFPRDTYIVTNVHVALYRMRAVPKILGMDNFPE